MKLHGNGAIFLLIFSEAKLSRIPATLPTPCDIIGQKAAFFDFLCADRKSAMSKKSSKIKGFRVRKKYFCEYLTHSDDLGRVVVPKEIRRTLRIREGDPLEIYTDREGGIILRKYSPIGELSQFSKQYAEALAQNTGYIVSITDRDRHIATAGSGKKELMQKEISRQLDNLMNQRENLLAVKGERKFISITEDGGENYTAQVIYPIIAEGDAIGTVILTTKDEKVRMGEMEMKLAASAASFLGRQLEQ